MKPLKISGFTIVELLIVIAIIAILATLVLVSYRGIQNRAYDTSVKADLINFGKKIEIVKNDSSTDTYPIATDLPLSVNVKFNKSAYLTNVHNLAYCRVNDGKEYALVAASKGGAQYFYSSIQGFKMYEYSWTQAAATTCPNVLSSGASYTNSWGYSAVNGWMWAN